MNNDNKYRLKLENGSYVSHLRLRDGCGMPIKQPSIVETSKDNAVCFNNFEGALNYALLIKEKLGIVVEIEPKE